MMGKMGALGAVAEKKKKCYDIKWDDNCCRQPRVMVGSDSNGYD